MTILLDAPVSASNDDKIVAPATNAAAAKISTQKVAKPVAAKTATTKTATAKTATTKTVAAKTTKPVAAKTATPITTKTTKTAKTATTKTATAKTAKTTAKPKVAVKKKPKVHARDVDDDYGLKLFFQPVFIPSENRVFGYECLLRIVDKDLGVITPDVFLGVAQKNASLMKGLEEWSMSELFRTARMFRQKQKFIDMISLNIDTQNFLRPDFYDRISNYFEKINDNIYIELKEDAFFSNDAKVAETLSKLRTAGIKIAVDDFTANFLSFEWGEELPFDMIKIDRAYTDRVMISPKAKLIIEKILAFGKERKLEIIAVGVESHEQEKVLTEMGCDMLQGYYYSKPLQIKRLLEIDEK